MKMQRATAPIAGFALALTIVAGALVPAHNVAAAEVSAEVIAAVTKKIAARTGGTEPDSVKPTPMDGLFQVVYGSEILYVSADARYIVRGDMIDLESRENLTEAVRSESRKTLVASIDEKSMIVYKGDGADEQPIVDGGPAKQVTVFTDVDCGYCAKLHSEMADYNKRGITIRYLAFPRAGIPSGSYDKTVSVWCSDDQRSAITVAKAGGEVAEAICENPVKSHYEAGRSLGVRGTPTMVLNDGTVLPGYLPPERLEAVLNGEEAG